MIEERFDTAYVARTATLPCPAEMGGSIHIRGTASSIVDTVFVCRKGTVPPEPVKHPERALAGALRRDVHTLAQAGHRATPGDVNCLAYGHLTRLVIAKLYATWDRTLPIAERLEAVRATSLSLWERAGVRAGKDGISAK